MSVNASTETTSVVRMFVGRRSISPSDLRHCGVDCGLINPSVATSSLAMRSTRAVSSLPMRSTKPSSTLPTRSPRAAISFRVLSPRAAMSLRQPPLSGNDDACKDNGRANDGDQFLAHLVSIAFPFRFGPDLE